MACSDGAMMLTCNCRGIRKSSLCCLIGPIKIKSEILRAGFAKIFYLFSLLNKEVLCTEQTVNGLDLTRLWQLFFPAICGIERQSSASVLGTRRDSPGIEETKPSGYSFQGKTSKLRTTSAPSYYGMKIIRQSHSKY